MRADQTIRNHLRELLVWNAAHADFERAVKNVPPELRGVRPGGAPYSLWELLEHIRTAQRDILDFCRNPNYQSPNWPDDFWPAHPEPPSREHWQMAIDSVKRDRHELISLLQRDDVDILEAIPHSEGQTYFREAVLVADHNAYHVGQMVLVRRLLGIWPP